MSRAGGVSSLNCQINNAFFPWFQKINHYSAHATGPEKCKSRIQTIWQNLSSNLDILKKVLPPLIYILKKTVTKSTKNHKLNTKIQKLSQRWKFVNQDSCNQ